VKGNGVDEDDVNVLSLPMKIYFTFSILKSDILVGRGRAIVGHTNDTTYNQSDELIVYCNNREELKRTKQPVLVTLTIACVHDAITD
jgi:hypothetical protein